MHLQCTRRAHMCKANFGLIKSAVFSLGRYFPLLSPVFSSLRLGRYSHLLVSPHALQSSRSLVSGEHSTIHDDLWVGTPEKKNLSQLRTTPRSMHSMLWLKSVGKTCRPGSITCRPGSVTTHTKFSMLRYILNLVSHGSLYCIAYRSKVPILYRVLIVTIRLRCPTTL
eukprot:SAG11_NODE_10508_length_825_cov_23.421488_1_plen_168_part_00